MWTSAQNPVSVATDKSRKDLKNRITPVTGSDVKFTSLTFSVQNMFWGLQKVWPKFENLMEKIPFFPHKTFEVLVADKDFHENRITPVKFVNLIVMKI